ncbi:hypothetical protein QL995_20955 [Pseudoalteromonas sp. APC 3358]|uniref:hypothetical protein n=1 Tax=Pseudoalteromonas sp. APC 3358 TaxID=3035176 RepID=UPI0025B40D97|nr:hypothetical protein [Pseudoalteromonas sp. APC 3358]MDN3385098.1 hypothetical protein [Pseudoalteromonas sp. APC 3358]
MKIIRLSHNRNTTDDKQLYDLVERLDTFSLLECRDRSSVCLENITRIVILDHSDEAENFQAIMDQVCQTGGHIQLVIIVDSFENQVIDLPIDLPVSDHIIVNPVQGSLLKRRVEDGVHVASEPEEILGLIKRSIPWAA